MTEFPAGPLRHRITVNAQSNTPDAYGQPVLTWTPLYECWSSINTITSKEIYSLGGFTAQVTHKISIRYPAVTVLAGMQIAYEGRTFHIQAVSDPDELKRQLDLFSQEISS